MSKRATAPCPACGTWVCSNCGWRRSKANRQYLQTCHRCGSAEGIMRYVFHQGWRYQDHIQEMKTSASKE